MSEYSFEAVKKVWQCQIYQLSWADGVVDFLFTFPTSSICKPPPDSIIGLQLLRAPWSHLDNIA
jgi:hypothetical protein